MNRVVVPQDTETRIHVAHASGGYALRYAYSRSAESRREGNPGQDYLVYAQGSTSLTFALCDGVGQSFYGELAASLLGNHLLAWMSTLPLTSIRTAELHERLTRELARAMHKAREKIDAHPVPDDLPDMVRQVLEEKRAFGSESTFVCGRLVLPRANREGSELLLCYAGDSRIRAWTKSSDQLVLLESQAITNARWSTHRGVVGGDVAAVALELEKDGPTALAGLACYSDGIPMLDDFAAMPANEFFDQLLRDQQSLPTSDDITFLEFAVGSTPPHWLAKPLGIPDDVRISSGAGGLSLNWAAVPGATGYEVAQEGEPTRRWAVDAPRWDISEGVGPSLVVRIRAKSSVNSSGWSAPIAVVCPSADREAVPVRAVSSPGKTEPSTRKPRRSRVWIALAWGALGLVVTGAAAIAVLAVLEIGPFGVQTDEPKVGTEVPVKVEGSEYLP